MLSRKSILLNLWYLVSIGTGLFAAWRQGASNEALLAAMLCVTGIVYAAVAIMAVLRYAGRLP